MIKQGEVAACIELALDTFLKDLDGEVPSGVYDMVLSCVERPLIEKILHYAEGNQTRAAEYLGINRNTLRKKMAQYNLQ
ncbi:MAG: Fis family transcriptional regulator [Betaproteobacteria bacterium]|nr:Fis family transcriptional regulator [Betaproteobacteria bacterium]